jgi:hypothetical protein
MRTSGPCGHVVSAYEVVNDTQDCDSVSNPGSSIFFVFSLVAVYRSNSLSQNFNPLKPGGNFMYHQV